MSNYSMHVDNSRAKQFKHNPMNTFNNNSIVIMKDGHFTYFPQKMLRKIQ